MYQYTGLNDRGNQITDSGIKVTFGGVTLNTALNNANGTYRTLTVSGRGLLEQDHRTTEVSGRHGSYYHGMTYEEREITIKALITGNDNLAYRKQLEDFNILLGGQNARYLSFSDEPDRFYLAKFKSASEPEETANQEVVTLNFVCYDPFKYTDERTVTGTNVNYVGKFETKPVITLTLSAGGNELRLLHVKKQQYVRLKGIYQAGNKIVIDMQKRTVTQNGRDILKDLDMVNSRFFSFETGRNDIYCNIDATLSSTFREVYL